MQGTPGVAGQTPAWPWRGKAPVQLLSPANSTSFPCHSPGGPAMPHGIHCLRSGAAPLRAQGEHSPPTEEPLPPGHGFIISGYTPCFNWHRWGQHSKLLLNAGSFTRSKRSWKPPCIHPQAASLSSLQLQAPLSCGCPRVYPTYPTGEGSGCVQHFAVTASAIAENCQHRKPIWHCLVHPQGKFLGQGLLVQRVTAEVVLVRTARLPYGGNEPRGRGFILLLELVPGGRFGARIWAKISNWIMWKTGSKS